jgi:membrane protease subunit HflK
MKLKLAILAIVIASTAALVVATGWCVVAPGEVAVVRRLGRLGEPPLSPGLHWRYPFGIDRLDRVRTDAVRQVTIGLASTAGADLEPSAGEVMTGDLNLLRVQATVQYRVFGPADFVLQSSQVEPLLAMSAEASVSRALAARGVDAVLRSERQAISRAVEQNLQAAVDRYRLGVTILGVSLTDARPPAEVQADFAAAQSAESDRDRRINEANSYEETTVTAARSGAQAELEAAHAAALRRTVLARAEAERFLTLMAEAVRSRVLTMRRLYVESLQTLLGRVKTKLILAPGDAVDLTVLGAQRESSRPAPKPAGPRQLPVPDQALPRAVEK